MQNLLRSLQDHDLGHLRIVAELWKIELAGSRPRDAASELAEAMLLPGNLSELLETLAPEVRQAVGTLQAHAGRLPWAEMERRFGVLREMGPGRRDREKPHRSASSITEALWYRGLIGRAFADTPTGPQEFAFLPEDLAARLGPAPAPAAPPGAPAAPPAAVLPADAGAVDDAVTLLASLRRAPQRQSPPPASWFASQADYLHQPESARLLIHLLTETGVLAGRPLQPRRDQVREFLERPAAEALARLAATWEASSTWNDLTLVPDLEPADGWPNDPLASRRAALELLARIPSGVWWGIDPFVIQVRSQEAGFLRPGSNFASWYLRHPGSDRFLIGIEFWDDIDGAFLRRLILGPLHWLGQVDLGTGDSCGTPTVFRRTDRPIAPPADAQPASITPDGRLRVPRQTPPPLRYQLARLGAWRPVDPEAYTFRLDPACLHAALGQGLQVSQMISLLESASGARLPEALRRAIERGARRGGEGRLEAQHLLRVAERRVMDELMRNRGTARWMGERLGPNAVLVDRAAWPRLRAAAARLGILLDGPEDD